MLEVVGNRGTASRISPSTARCPLPTESSSASSHGSAKKTCSSRCSATGCTATWSATARAALAQRNDVGLVATGRVCYHERARSRTHDVLTAIRHNLTLETSHRQRKANSRYELKSPERMEQLSREWPEAAENSRRIADRCEPFSVKQMNCRFPRESVPEEFADEQEHLEHICNEAARRRYGRMTDKVRERLSASSKGTDWPASSCSTDASSRWRKK